MQVPRARKLGMKSVTIGEKCAKDVTVFTKNKNKKKENETSGGQYKKCHTAVLFGREAFTLHFKNLTVKKSHCAHLSIKISARLRVLATATNTHTQTHSLTHSLENISEQFHKLSRYCRTATGLTPFHPLTMWRQQSHISVNHKLFCVHRRPWRETKSVHTEVILFVCFLFSWTVFFCLFVFLCVFVSPSYTESVRNVALPSTMGFHPWPLLLKDE